MKRAWLLAGLLLLTGASFWMKQRMQAPAQPHAAPAFEYQIHGLKLLSTNARGQAELELQAEALVKVTDKPLLQLTAPVIHLNDQPAETPSAQTLWHWSIQASKGWLHSDTQVVDMEQQVRVEQIHRDHPLKIQSEHLRYLPEQKTASSKSAIRMEQGSMQLTAVGMTANLQTQIIELKQAVQGSIHVP